MTVVVSLASAAEVEGSMKHGLRYAKTAPAGQAPCRLWPRVAIAMRHVLVESHLSARPATSFELSYRALSKVQFIMSSNATPGCFVFLRRSRRAAPVGVPPADPGALSRRSRTAHTSESALKSHYVPEPCGCSLASHDLASLQIRDELPPYHSVREAFNKDVRDLFYPTHIPRLC
jgi:hypothetical protein